MSKTVLITGSTSGIGAQLTHLFAKDGYHLILVSRNKQKLEKQQKQFPNNTVTIIPLDLTKPNAANDIFTHLTKKKISIDILVNNAGFGSYGRFHIEDPQTQLDMIQLNITTLTQLTRLITPQMVKRKSGKILNVASTAAFLSGPLMAVYYATKNYVLAFSEALTNELKDYNISVTTLCPGPTTTNFQKTADLNQSKLLSFTQSMTAQEVAKQGYNGLINSQTHVIPGFTNQFFIFLPRLLPRNLTTWITRRVQDFK